MCKRSLLLRVLPLALVFMACPHQASAGSVIRQGWWTARDNDTGARTQATVFYVGAAADVTAITPLTVGDMSWSTDTHVLRFWDGAAWNAVGGSSGAPTTATYKTQTPDATLSAEEAWSTLGTGIVLNATGTGVASIYGGTSCTNQFPRSLSASGAATCASVASADLNITGTTCTNQFLTALSSSAAGTCTTDTLASAQHANQGTTTTLLHGNAAGNPSWGAVALATDVSGALPTTNGGTGTDTTLLTANKVFVTTGGAYSTTTLPTCSNGTTDKLLYNNTTQAFSCGVDQTGAGSGLTYAEVAAATLAGF